MAGRARTAGLSRTKRNTRFCFLSTRGSNAHKRSLASRRIRTASVDFSTLSAIAATARIYLYQKKCSGWSDRNGKGALLGWDGLHPKAKEFLFTEGTFAPCNQ
jgi:hypothetical protein